MKTNKIFSLNSLVALGLILLGACTDQAVDPILPNASAFIPPQLINTSNSVNVDLLPANASSEFEKFEWKRSDYGVQVSVKYVLEVDVDPAFSAPQKLGETSGNTLSLSVEKLNDALLALGIPGFTKDTVSIRVNSTIIGFDSPALYSNVITRIFTTYQLSDCGNFCSMGLIGDATAGGWNDDIDMHLLDPAKVDKYTWTATVNLVAGGVKFRANDGWTDNWGAATYPSGIGVPNGANIPITTPGYYKITFNDNTGDYSFTQVGTTVYTMVSLIGDATNWSTDIDLVQDGADAHLWTGTATLGVDGGVKFRADHGWTNNWGSDTYPSGFGTGGGPNIPVPAGTYFVRFNDASGEYAFMPTGKSTPYTLIGLIGDATPGGWGADTGMIKNPVNPFLWSKTVTLIDGGGKFRADGAWTVNWGASGFPGGIGAQDGPNIPVKGGTYFVTFHSGTGEYYFLK